jgi:predicted nucleic acid-binding protein
MRYIVNATFTINISRTNIDIVENIEFHTIKETIEEATNELGIKIDEYVHMIPISPGIKKGKLKIPSTKRRSLSATDIKLLNMAYVNKKDCILITDDKQVRFIAKANNIRSYTTPQYIAYMVKKELISYKEGITFLNNLKKIYIRPKDIEAVLKRIKKWR